MFKRAGLKEGGMPLPPAFQYLIFVMWRACNLNAKTYRPTISYHKTAKNQAFQLQGLTILKPVMVTKLKSQALRIIRIKY